jgi:hypothetical protein
MNDYSRNYTEAKDYCESQGYHLAYIENYSKYLTVLNYARDYWQTNYAGFNIDSRNHWLGMQYQDNREVILLDGSDTTGWATWYPSGYPTSLTRFPDNDRMVILVSVSVSNSIYQGMRNIDPYSLYYAICQDPYYISTL